jgi:signal transduction histidine kinase
MPILKAAAGCTVSGIFSAGENVWRINVTNRRHGEAQRIELEIVLPVTQQVWFWLLVAVVATSLMFAGWRYVVSLRFQRQSALAMERTRIARDLHDNLGANLAQIGLLTEQVERALDQPAQARQQLDRVLGVSRAIAKQLDEVVWAVDPANDTLEDCARYIHGYAVDYLALAAIRCRFTNVEELPPIVLSSVVRHNLLMSIKEALHNVVQHAAASVVTLRLRLAAQAMVLEIEDDGRGVQAAGIPHTGNGLSNMQRRLAAIGGRCEILPGNGGRGTLVRLTVPLSSLR